MKQIIKFIQKTFKPSEVDRMEGAAKKIIKSKKVKLTREIAYFNVNNIGQLLIWVDTPDVEALRSEISSAVMQIDSCTHVIVTPPEAA